MLPQKISFNIYILSCCSCWSRNYL